MNVLIVSENLDLINQVKSFDEGKDQQIQISGLRNNLLNASQTISTQLPDIVLVDTSANQASEMDLIERFKLQHPNITFMMLSNDQSSDLLLKAIRTGVSEVIMLPISESSFFDAIDRYRKKRLTSNGADAKILSFISCKGGSGSTFISTNLGFILAEATNKKVLLIDLNQYFGDASLYVSEQIPSKTLNDVCTQIHRIDSSLLDSCLVNVSDKFKVLAAPLSPSNSLDVLPDHIETILNVARINYDIIILDLGRQIDAITLRALDLSDQIYLVLQLVLPYIRDGKHLMEIFSSLGYPDKKIGLIVNRYDKAGNLKLEDLTNSLNAEVITTIPNHYTAVNESVNHGIPIYKFAKNSVVTNSLYLLAKEITGDKSQEISLLQKIKLTISSLLKQ